VNALKIIRDNEAQQSKRQAAAGIMVDVSWTEFDRILWSIKQRFEDRDEEIAPLVGGDGKTISITLGLIFKGAANEIFDKWNELIMTAKGAKASRDKRGITLPSRNFSGRDRELSFDLQNLQEVTRSHQELLAEATEAVEKASSSQGQLSQNEEVAVIDESSSPILVLVRGQEETKTEDEDSEWEDEEGDEVDLGSKRRRQPHEKLLRRVRRHSLGVAASAWLFVPALLLATFLFSLRIPSRI
jgi:hypothetical protein